MTEEAIKNDNPRGDTMKEPKPWRPRDITLTEYDCEIAEKYLADCSKVDKGQVRVPWIEELALMLKVDSSTVWRWCEAKDTDERAKLFCNTVKKLKDLQKLRLQQRTLGRFNAAGPIFLLKANHGLKDRIDLTSDDQKLEAPAVIIKTNKDE